MESSDEEEGRTFVQVLSEKYNPENFPYCRGQVVVLSSPQGSPIKDRLNLPSVLVVDGCGISRAGDEEDLATLCAHVVELDLSHNQLQDWSEISTIVSNIPNLDFLNLSTNPLSGAELEGFMAEAFSRVRRLVLNNTRITWHTVHTLTQQIPELEELFLCLNEYDSVAPAPLPCPCLRLLHITDNNLKDWTEVRKFGPMFPGLNTLVLANNSLSSIQDNQDTIGGLFPNLHSINLNNSGLYRWEDIERLNVFPKLKEVRVMGIPLLQPYSNSERRYLMVAQLPSVSVLNGSVVTAGEREDAERFFIRFYLDTPAEELPDRYHSLVEKYGKLAPLAEVDLSPQCCALVEVSWGEQVAPVSVRLEGTVADLKKQLRTLVQLPPSRMRLFYVDKQLGYALEPLEMKYSSRALHTYHISDGDDIIVMPKT